MAALLSHLSLLTMYESAAAGQIQFQVLCIVSLSVSPPH